ncbi:hypothetical protein SETIT_6G030700v2 [Setaria italica]|uniref:Uncharacterized protein n=1 Tax=Setaria italica TaxID=4555 RepID=K3YIG4_SETIT|nr:uncharacterized protein LOC101762892 isoform X1 [Setaria italica]RCV29671.1 hypothetical protein SETIT_6G030700v2 [Setaria italica]
MEEPLNSSRPPVRRWRQASVYWNAGRRFFSNPPAEARDSDQDDEQKDLEKNSTLVRQPPASVLLGLPARSFLVINPIKRTISRLVRAVVVNDTPQDQLQEQQKRCSRYSQKALLFAITTFVAYLGSSSASSSTGNTAFKVAMAAFFVAIPIDLISVTRTPRWGYTLVYLSWFLLVLLSYLLLVSFHKDYRCAIIPVLLLFFAALLQRKLRPSVRQQNTTNTKPAQHLDSDEGDDRALENVFEWSAGVVNCGGLISMILGHYMYMVGPDHLTEVSIIGFLFFFTVVLGLYLMMVTTVRNAELTLYVGILPVVLGFLLVGTLIATVIQGVWLSRNDSHV